MIFRRLVKIKVIKYNKRLEKKDLKFRQITILATNLKNKI